MADTALACASCAAAVDPDELVQGLAVRIDGRIVCRECVDSLPGAAQLHINQMRALRGLPSTTYEVRLARHPQLALFSFSSAALAAQHRRALTQGTAFATQPLPPPDKRVRLTRPGETTPAQRRQRLVAAAIVGGVALLAAGGVAMLLMSGPARPAQQAIQQVQPPKPPAQIERPAPPTFAPINPIPLPVAASDPDLHPVAGAREEVADRLARLERIKTAIAAGELAEAERALEELTAQSRGFAMAEVRERIADVRQLLNQRRAKPVVPPMPPEPAQTRPPEPPVAARQPEPPKPETKPEAKPDVKTEPRPVAGPESFEVAASETGELNTRVVTLPNPLRGGSYQVWMRLRIVTTKAQPRWTVSAEEQAIAPAFGRSDLAADDGWTLVARPLQLPAGTRRFQIASDTAATWNIAAFFVAGADLAPPAGAVDPASRPATPPDAAKPAADPVDAAKVWTDLHLDQLAPGAVVDETKGFEQQLPVPFPVPCTGFLRSAGERGKSEQHRLDLHLVDLPAGTAAIQLTLHRGHPERKQIKAFFAAETPLLIDIDRARADDHGWMRVMIPVPAGATGPLILADTGRIAKDRGFLVSRAVAFPRPEQSGDHWPIRFGLQMPPAGSRESAEWIRAFADRVAQVAAWRKAQLKRLPTTTKILIAGGLEKNWKSGYRELLETWTGVKPPELNPTECNLTATWWDEHQLGKDPIIEPKEFLFAAIAYNGAESDAWNSPDDGTNYLIKLQTKLREKANCVIPVHVVGSLRDTWDGKRRDAVDRLWSQVLPANGRLTHLVIDARWAQERPTLASREAQTGRIVLAGVRTLTYLVRWQQSTVK